MSNLSDSVLLTLGRMINPGWMPDGRPACESPSILGHDHPILGDAARDDDVIQFTARAANISWMGSVVHSRSVEVMDKLGREAFVDE